MHQLPGTCLPCNLVHRLNMLQHGQGMALCLLFAAPCCAHIRATSCAQQAQATKPASLQTQMQRRCAEHRLSQQLT